MKVEREGWRDSFEATHRPYEEIRHCHGTKPYCIVTRRDKKGYFISSTEGDPEGHNDIGPFDTFEAAAACLETMGELQ